MTDYSELVKALRCCTQNPPETCVGCTYNIGNNECAVRCMMCDAAAAIEALRILQDKNSLSYYKQVCKDAADAIEALNRLVDPNTERCEGLLKQLREAQEQYEKHLNELEQQLPKRGEWVEENRRPRSSQFVCSECHRTAYDPQPTRDKAWRKRCRYAYCPNCGAKMEVQE